MQSLMLHRARSAALLLAAVAGLWGCAAYEQQKEGMALLDEGRYEEGLAKLDAAAKAHPSDFTYRTSLQRSRDQVIVRLLGAAGTERATDHRDAARAIYERVLRIDPGNSLAKTGIAALEADQRHDVALEETRKLIKKGDFDGARAALKPVFLEDPKNPEAVALTRQIDEQLNKELLASPLLRTQFRKPVSLQFRDANLKMVFEALSRTSGINVLLDKDVRPDLKTSIFVQNVSVEDVIDLILLQNQLEKKILSDNTVFVYPNTPAKLKDYQDLKIRSFHLTNADPKQMLTMIKTLLNTKDIFVNEKTNSIVIRDTPEAVRLAEKLIGDQDSADPEVMLEVEVLEVTRSKLSEIGIQFPDQLTLTATGTGPKPSGTSTAAAGVTLDNLRHINATNILTSPALAATLNFHLDEGDVNILASPRIRVRNREKARIMIGDRVPVITNSVTPLATGTPVVTGSVTYLDVGMKLEVEPDINPDSQVAIKVNLDVSSIAKEIDTPSGTVAYQVGTRNATTVLRLKDGETQILAGLISDEDRHTAVEVPLLGQIPILGRLFSSHRKDKTKTEIVLSITPRIVNPAKIPDARELEYWTGTETSLRSSQMVLKQMGNVSLSSSAGAVQVTPAPARQLTVSPVQPAPATANPTPAAPATISPVQPTPATANPAPAVPAVVSPTPASSTAPRAPSSAPPGEGASGDGATPLRGAATPGPMVLSWQGPSQAKVGDRISLTLNTDSPQGAKSLALMVRFDPAQLKVVDVTEGSLLKQVDPGVRFTQIVNQKGGQVMVGFASQVAGQNPLSGSVATLTFEVTASSGQSQISVGRINPVGVSGETLSFVAPEPYLISLGQ